MAAEPLAELDRPFLMAGGADISSFTRECEDSFRATGIASNPGKALMQIPARSVMDHNLLHVGPPEAVALLESLGSATRSAWSPGPCFSRRTVSPLS